MNSTNTRPLVSIIVITYNSSQTIIETLESAKIQTYPDIELIITDDGSEDETVELSMNWIMKNGNRFVRSELIKVELNTGIPANCNRGVKSARGEWLKIIAGDDILDKECLTLNMEFIEKHHSDHIEILTSNMYVFDSSNYMISNEPSDFSAYKFNNVNISIEEQYQIALRMAYINVPTLFIKQELFHGKVGFYDERYKLYEDKPWVLKALKAGVKVHFAPFYSVYYRKSILSVQKINSAKNLIPDFQIMRDQFILNAVIKDLPLIEKTLQLYLIFFKIAFRALTRNRNTRINNFLFRIFTNFPNTLLAKKHLKYT